MVQLVLCDIDTHNEPLSQKASQPLMGTWKVGSTAKFL